MSATRCDWCEVAENVAGVGASATGAALAFCESCVDSAEHDWITDEATGMKVLVRGEEV